MKAESGLCFVFAASAWLWFASPALAEIHDDPNAVNPPLPGQTAPAFQVFDTDGKPVAFDPESLEQPVIITFYRGGWCPYCNLHLAELRRIESELTAMGFALWFISADRPEVLADGADGQAEYRLLSDASLAAAQAFDIAFRVDDETVARYRDYGIDLEAASGHDHHGLPVPATFLVGADGTIQFSFVNPDYTVRLAPEVLLAAAKAYRDQAHRRLNPGGDE